MTEETTMSDANEQCRSGTDIHTRFSLTYANYLVLPRSLLQSLPEEMQYRLTEVLDEIGNLALANDVPFPDYRVQTVDDRGRYMRDPVPHYNRGRTKIDLSASA